MIESLEITGFRRFRQLRVGGLRRINLFVGKNNCGKTTVLEAVATLANHGDLQSLRSFMERRGELLAPELVGPIQASPDLDVRRLFYGHVIDAGSTFLIRAREGDGYRVVKFRITDSFEPVVIGAVAEDVVSQEIDVRKPSVQSSPKSSRPEERSQRARYLQIEGHTPNRGDSVSTTLIGGDGGLASHKAFGRSSDVASESEFVSLESSSAQRMAEGWSSVALTAEQDLVEDAIRLLDKDLQKIAYVQDPTTPWGTFRVKLRSFDLPVPLGSLGGGIWRMLAMVIALVKSKGGFLLVDELDTGLHHSVLTDVWRILIETAVKLNVQVFATTHSLDCIKGLATLCHADGKEADDQIAMHRIEKDKCESVHYSERQIVIAAERGIETR